MINDVFQILLVCKILAFKYLRFYIFSYKSDAFEIINRM